MTWEHILLFYLPLVGVKTKVRADIPHYIQHTLAHSAGAAEYADCISAKGQFPGYDTKQFDGEVPVIQEL